MGTGPTCVQEETARPHDTNKRTLQRELATATEVQKGRRHVCEDVTGRNVHDPRIVIDSLAATKCVKNIKQTLIHCVCLQPGYMRSIQAVRCLGGDGFHTPSPLRDFAARQNSFGRRCIRWCGGNGGGGERDLFPRISIFLYVNSPLVVARSSKCLRVFFRDLGTCACFGRENGCPSCVSQDTCLTRVAKTLNFPSQIWLLVCPL